jgi:hypothetical protein
MNTAQIITITIMCILAIVSYYKIGFNIYFRNNNKGVLWLALLTLICLFSLFVVGDLIFQKTKLEKQVKEKCPQYEKVDNVYKLK